MRRIHHPTFAATALLALISSPALAASKDATEQGGRPQLFQALVDCRGIADATARVACYDAATDALTKAQEKKDIVIADRAMMAETRRGLFGLSLPSLKLFGGDVSEDVQEIESTITSVRSSPDGFAVFVLEDGARWRQTDGRDLYAKPGQKIRIRRSTMGGYMANVENKLAVRVVRLAN